MPLLLHMQAVTALCYVHCSTSEDRECKIDQQQALLPGLFPLSLLGCCVIGQPSTMPQDAHNQARCIGVRRIALVPPAPQACRPEGWPADTHLQGCAPPERFSPASGLDSKGLGLSA